MSDEGQSTPQEVGLAREILFGVIVVAVVLVLVKVVGHYRSAWALNSIESPLTAEPEDEADESKKKKSRKNSTSEDGPPANPFETSSTFDTDYVREYPMRDKYYKEKEKVKEVLNNVQLCSALFRRALDAANTVIKVQRDAPGIQRGQQDGYLPEGVFENFLQGQQLLHEELEDIVNEAEELKPGWGKGGSGMMKIIQQAVNMHMKQQLQKHQEDLQKYEENKKVKEEKAAIAKEEEDKVRAAKQARKMEQQLIREEEQRAQRESKKTK